MAYDGSLLHALVDSIAGGSLRWYGYGPTDDSIPTILTVGYMTDGRLRGLRVNDIVFAYGDGPGTPQVLSVVTVSANGAASLTLLDEGGLRIVGNYNPDTKVGTDMSSVMAAAETSLMAGTKLLVLEGDILCSRSQMLTLSGLRNVEIEGHNCTIWFDGENSSEYPDYFLKVSDSDGFTIRGVGADYVNPPFFQGICRAVGGSTVDIEADDGFDPTFGTIENAWHMNRDRREYGDYVVANDNATLTFVSGQTWRLSGGSFTPGDFTVGESYVLSHLNFGCDFVEAFRTSGFRAIDCLTEQVAGISFFIKSCPEPYFENCGADVPSGSDWMCSDGGSFHIGDSRGEIVLENCRGLHCRDDSVNIFARFGQVTVVGANTVTVQWPDSLSVAWAWEAGDELQPITAENASALTTFHIATVVHGVTTSVITTVEAVPVGLNTTYYLANLDCEPRYKITGGRFGHNVNNGALVNGHGTVLGNSFESTRGRAILSNYAAQIFHEGPNLNKTLIAMNHIEECANGVGTGGAILVKTFDFAGEDDPDTQPLTEIIVSNNFIRGSDDVAIGVHQARYVAVTGNVLMDIARDGGNAMELDRLVDLVVSGNTGIGVLGTGNIFANTAPTGVVNVGENPGLALANITPTNKSFTITNLNAVATNQTLVIPAGFAIDQIHFANGNGNAVTGGMKIGTTSGGVDVVAAQAIAGNAVGTVLDADLLKKVFAFAAPQTLFIQAVTSWNSASVFLSFVMKRVF